MNAPPTPDRGNFLIASFCNQTKQHRLHDLAIIDPDSGAVGVVTLRCPRPVRGITGICRHHDLLIMGIQEGAGHRLIVVDPDTWDVVSAYASDNIRDVHSLVVHDTHVLVVSSGNNAIFRLTFAGNRIVGDELYWRYPETSATDDDVHLNCLTVYAGRLIACCFNHRTPEGHWAQQDGRVFDVLTGETLLAGLGQPHTAYAAGTHLYVCESRTGKMFAGAEADNGWAWQEITGRGYTRGVLKAGDRVFLGISSSRQFSRIHNTPVTKNTAPYSGCEIAEVDAGGQSVVPLCDLSGIGNEVYDVIQTDCRWPDRSHGPTVLFRLRQKIFKSRWP